MPPLDCSPEQAVKKSTYAGRRILSTWSSSLDLSSRELASLGNWKHQPAAEGRAKEQAAAMVMAKAMAVRYDEQRVLSSVRTKQIVLDAVRVGSTHLDSWNLSIREVQQHFPQLDALRLARAGMGEGILREGRLSTGPAPPLLALAVAPATEGSPGVKARPVAPRPHSSSACSRT